MSVEISPQPSLLKAVQVAEILNVSKAFAYQLMQKGMIPTVKILGARRVRIEDLNRFIQENISQQNRSAAGTFKT